MKEPCTCQGNNPTCFKCGGWGYIDVIGKSRSAAGAGELAPRGPPRKSKPRRIKNAVAHKKTPDWVLCPICKIQCRHLDRHLNKAHKQTQGEVITPE